MPSLGRWIGCFACLTLAACQTGLPEIDDGRIPTPVIVADGSPQRAALNAEVYDASIEMVERRFYDRNFNGAAFGSIARQHRADALAQSDEAGFYATLNNVLARLGDAHTHAVPPTAYARAQRSRLTGGSSFGFALTTAVHAETGSRHFFVMSVQPGSPAELAGVRRGWRIETVDGEMFDPSRIYAGAPRLFQFVDAEDDLHEIWLEAVNLSRSVGTAVVTEDGVLVLQFDRFDDASAAWVLEQVEAAGGEPLRAIILDLRGNRGGLIDATATILGAFFPEPVRFAYYSYGPVPRVPRQTRGADRPWRGPALVLVSAQTRSAAEVVAAAFQHHRRGPVVGTTTAGAVVGANSYQLPDGGLLSIGEGEFRTANGAVIEKVGVIPDHRTDWTYEALAEGRDLDIERALELLR